jgi:hypothetical protein
MNAQVTILGVLGVVIILFSMWYRLKDVKEGDLVYVGLGTYMEYTAFVVRSVLALVGFLIVLLAGLFI